MSIDDVNLDASSDAAFAHVGLDPGEPLDAMDVQTVRLLLGGGSVVDWRRLAFDGREEAIRHLAVNGYDIDDHAHRRRLRALQRRAIDYIDTTFDIHLPASVRRPADPCALLLAASAESGPEQRAACVVLKVMHVINHLEARRLAYHLPVSERTLFEAALNKILAHVRQMVDSGLEIVSYEPSTKSDHSLLTKLVSKPRVTAAQIFDRLRCRIITRRREDLVLVVRWLTRHLLPFNHLIPGESHNTILDDDELRAALDGPTAGEVAPWAPSSARALTARNPATASSFETINFVVDLPVRVGHLCPREELERYEHLGLLVFVTVEIQLFDEATFDRNAVGESSHAAYKRRQLDAVATRLWGADAPALRGARSA